MQSLSHLLPFKLTHSPVRAKGISRQLTLRRHAGTGIPTGRVYKYAVPKVRKGPSQRVVASFKVPPFRYGIKDGTYLLTKRELERVVYAMKGGQKYQDLLHLAVPEDTLVLGELTLDPRYFTQEEIDGYLNPAWLKDVEIDMSEPDEDEERLFDAMLGIMEAMHKGEKGPDGRMGYRPNKYVSQDYRRCREFGIEPVEGFVDMDTYISEDGNSIRVQGWMRRPSNDDMLGWTLGKAEAVLDMLTKAQNVVYCGGTIEVWNYTKTKPGHHGN